MNKPGIRYVSTFVSVGVVSLAIVHCSSSSSSGGSLDGGGGGSGGGSSTTSTTSTTTTTTTTTGGGAGGGVNCAPAAGDSACTMCLKSMCCTESQACANSTDCYNLLMCLANCTAAACIDNCYAMYPNGRPPLDTLLNCSTTKCQTACSGP